MGAVLNRLLKILLLVIVSGALVSCTCTNPLIVSEIQKSDKKLTCKDVILEINESEHYRELAKREEGIGIGEALMPICWASSFLSATRAAKAAETRIAYLGHIYDVMDCGGKSDRGGIAAPLSAPFVEVQPMPAPPPVQQTLPPPSEVSAPQKEETTQLGGCNSNAEIEKNTHRHVDKFGRTYVHCHSNSGPHRHIDDQ